MNIPPRGKIFPRPPPMGVPINNNNNNNMLANNNISIPNHQFTIPPNLPIQPTTFPSSMIPNLIFEGHIIGNNNNTTDPMVSELFLKSKSYLLEGFHIVPNKIKVPGTSFEGKTFPDMSMRPFSLHVFARVVTLEHLDFSVQHVLSLTINGGIEWLAIPHPFDKLPIDYLSFDGDFEVLSIMIHGKVVDSGAGSERMEDHLPVPIYYNDISLENNEVESEFVGRDAIPMIEKKEIDAFHQKINSPSAKASLYDYLRDLQLQKSRSLDKIDSKFSVRYSESPVPIQRVAELVEHVFSIDQNKIINISVLNNLLEQCWQMDPTEVDRSSSTAVQMGIGVEAATLMVDILLKQLQSLGSDMHSDVIISVGALDSEDTNETLRNFTGNGMEILRYCKNLLVNEFTATEFSDAGGIEILISLLQQQPQLPMKLLEQLVFCLFDASLFPNVALKITKSASSSHMDESDQSDTTTYQAILYIAAGLKSTSPLFGPTKCLVNWLSFLDASKELEQLANSLITDSINIADAIGWRYSLNNSSSMVEEVSDSCNNTEESENVRLHTTAEVITNAYKNIAHITNQWIRSVSSILSEDFISTFKKTIIMSGGSNNYSIGMPFNNSLYSSILDVLFFSNFIASLSSLVSFAKLVAEFECILDWSSSSHEMIAYSRYINQAVISLVSYLFKFPKFELLLAACSEDVDLIRNFIQNGSCHIDISLQYLTRTYDSLDLREDTYDGIDYIDNNVDSFITSASWTMWLIVHIFCMLDEIFNKLISLDNFDGDSSCESVYELLTSILTLASNCDIGILISRLISHYYINSIIKALSLLYNHSNENFTSSVTEKVFNIFEIFLNSLDEIVLNTIYRKKDQLLKILTELKVSNSINVFFNNQNSAYRISQLCIILELEIPFFNDGSEDEKLVNTIQKLESNIISQYQFSRFLNNFKINGYESSSLIMDIINKLVIRLCDRGLNSNVTGNFGMEDLKALNSIENVLQYNSNILLNLFSCLTFICRNSSLLFENFYLFSNKDEIKLLVDVILYSHMFAKSVMSHDFKTVFANESTKVMSVCANVLLFFIHNKSNKYLASCRIEAFSYMISQSTTKPQLSDTVIQLLAHILPGGHFCTICSIPFVESEGTLKEDNKVFDFFKAMSSVSLGYTHESNHLLIIGNDLVDHIPLNESPDILYRSHYDNKMSMEIIVLMNFSSCVKSIKENSLTLAKILFSSNMIESINFGSIISHYLQRYISLSMQLFSESSEKVVILDESVLALTINILTFIDTLAADEIPCYILVNCGILYHLFCGLHSDIESITLLSLQCLTSIYKMLTKISLKDINRFAVTGMPNLHDLMSLILYKLSFSMVELIPSLLNQFKNNVQLNVLQQISLLLQLMPSVNIKQFLSNLNNIGEGLTIEFFAVKLWIEFEESFQLMVESTDILKLLSSSLKTEATKDFDKEDISKSLCTYHMLFMRACVSLKAITDLTLKCYIENMINLSTLSKSMRTSLADPKKVMIRYQRLYTMWSSGLPNIIGIDSSYTDSPSWSDYYDNDLFESRQNMISLSLKGLVDNLSKFSKFYLSKEEKYGGGIHLDSSKIEEDLTNYNLDFKTPFTTLDKKFPSLSNDILNELFTKSNYYSRLGNKRSSITNIIHNDLRRYLKPNPSSNILKSDLIALIIPSVKRQLNLIEGKTSKRKYINYSIDVVSKTIPSPSFSKNPTFSNPTFNKFNKPQQKSINPTIGNNPPNIHPTHFQKFN